MDEDFINQGTKLQKLDYSQLVFLQINRLGFEITNFNSGSPRDFEHNKKYARENISFGLSFLESMIIYQLSEKERENYYSEKKRIVENLPKLFDLLMKYLPKTNIMPAVRRTIETDSESDVSE